MQTAIHTIHPFVLKVTVVLSLWKPETLKRRSNILNYPLPRDVSVAFLKLFKDTTMKPRLFASNCFSHPLAISLAQWHYRSQ